MLADKVTLYPDKQALKRVGLSTDMNWGQALSGSRQGGSLLNDSDNRPQLESLIIGSLTVVLYMFRPAQGD